MGLFLLDCRTPQALALLSFSSQLSLNRHLAGSSRARAAWRSFGNACITALIPALVRLRVKSVSRQAMDEQRDLFLWFERVKM